MAEEADDTKPMMELEAANIDLEHQPEPAKETLAEPEIAPAVDTDSPQVASIQETSSDTPFTTPASSPAADGEIGLIMDEAGNHPVKPPRLKSMRSKESPPLIHIRGAEETKDVEAAISGPKGDSNAMDMKPHSPELKPYEDKVVSYEPEMKSDEPEMKPYEPEMKPYEPEMKPYEPTTAPLLPTQKDAVKPKKKFGMDYILNSKWLILGIIAVTLVILIIIIVSVTVSRKPPPKPPVPVVYEDPVVYNLKCGEAVGSWELDYNVAVFKGIPYLQPPVGNKRWSYDLEFASADDCGNVTKNTEFKSPCFQLNTHPDINTTYLGSEDCLYLNIWTPSLSTDSTVKEKLPVLVYIHGGFLHFGSGNEDLFSPSAQIAEDLNSVVLSFNYRLNAFGWLALKELETDTSLSGNYGLYDQIAALQWVKEYIDNFGGDPTKVTVAGLSSGGTSVLALLTNSDARQTFQRAWISGASSKFDGDKSVTYETNSKSFLRNLECADESKAAVRSCLMSKTKEELVEGIPWLNYPSWEAMDLVRPPSKDEFIGAVLINDGKYIATAPDEYFSTNTDISIPILIGNTEYESDRYQVEPLAKWSWGRYSDYLRSRMDTFSTNKSDYLVQDYAPDLKSNPRLHMARLVSDLRSICPQTFIADELKDHSNASVYRYVMTAKAPKAVSDKYLGGSAVATHGGDFAMLFHYSDDDSDEFKATKTQFRNLIKSFMRTGMVDIWDKFPVVYDIGSEKANATSRWTTEDCQRWKEYYPAYSWMN